MSLKTTKFKLIIGIIALLIIILCCALLLFPPQPTGEEIFKDLVVNPIPSSVTILNWREEDYCCEDWLHFKISPEDFKYILKSKKWEKKSLDTTDPYPFMEMDHGYRRDPPSWWWEARRFGNSGIQYFLVIRTMTDNQGYVIKSEEEYMLVSPQEDEVYLYYLNMYPH